MSPRATKKIAWGKGSAEPQVLSPFSDPDPEGVANCRSPSGSSTFFQSHLGFRMAPPQAIFFVAFSDRNESTCSGFGSLVAHQTRQPVYRDTAASRNLVYFKGLEHIDERVDLVHGT